LFFISLAIQYGNFWIHPRTYIVNLFNFTKARHKRLYSMETVRTILFMSDLKFSRRWTQNSRFSGLMHLVVRWMDTNVHFNPENRGYPYTTLHGVTTRKPTNPILFIFNRICRLVRYSWQHLSYRHATFNHVLPPNPRSVCHIPTLYSNSSCLQRVRACIHVLRESGVTIAGMSNS